MKLKQIEEIATKPVPVWQPALLISLLLLGFFAVPLITPKKAPQPEPKKELFGAILGTGDIKKQLTTNVQNAVKPLSATIQKEAGVVLGLAQQALTQSVQNIASQSGEQAKEFVLDNTLGKLLQNINSLSNDQQDYIKKAICK